MQQPQLSIIGTGIQPVRHMTPESVKAIQEADVLVYLIPETHAAQHVQQFARGEIVDASMCYQSGRPLAESYNEMVERAMGPLRQQRRVCFALYGHPGVIVYPSHRLLRQAKQEGFSARMFPGISAEDCLLADLGIDPASQGCQSYWATDLLLNHRQLDASVATILWSVGVAGCCSYSDTGMSAAALAGLLERLYRVYTPTHQVIVYEAAQDDNPPPRVEPIMLSGLPQTKLDGASTLYIPPALPTMPDWHQYARFQFPPSATTEIFRAHDPILDHS